jgi:hypothetical protein
VGTVIKVCVTDVSDAGNKKVVVSERALVQEEGAKVGFFGLRVRVQGEP